MIYKGIHASNIQKSSSAIHSCVTTSESERKVKNEHIVFLAREKNSAGYFHLYCDIQTIQNTIWNWLLFDYYVH